MTKNRYTMVFAFTHDATQYPEVLLLQKPVTHHNPLFRGKWTAPGGLLEDGETEAAGAAREFQEETGIAIDPERLRYILRFACNCDPCESEHEIVVFAAVLTWDALRRAKGTYGEPVALFLAGGITASDERYIWNTAVLVSMCLGLLNFGRLN